MASTTVVPSLHMTGPMGCYLMRNAPRLTNGTMRRCRLPGKLKARPGEADSGLMMPMWRISVVLKQRLLKLRPDWLVQLVMIRVALAPLAALLQAAPAQVLEVADQVTVVDLIRRIREVPTVTSNPKEV